MTGEVQATGIEGCFFLRLNKRVDERGFFLKPFSLEQLRSHGQDFKTHETFISESAKNVLRGMHFQIPPHDHAKLVVCLRGRISDTILDLRKSSTTFKKAVTYELNGDDPKLLVIPKGMAHGFLALTEGAQVAYWVDSSYSPAHDQGVHWASFGVSWPVENPLVSVRDNAFPHLKDFVSPF